jgi:mono/diheme cytochrome c family protein
MNNKRWIWIQGPAMMAVAVVIGGCTLQWQNTQPAQAYAAQVQAPGSPYLGWRVFQDKCVACHGADAMGTAGAPDLLPRVREMGPRRFAGLVLARYDWNLPDGDREAMTEQLLQGRRALLTMPAWQGEPRVDTHNMDLYAYLAARAEGRLGTGRPTP